LFFCKYLFYQPAMSNSASTTAAAASAPANPDDSGKPSLPLCPVRARTLGSAKTALPLLFLQPTTTTVAYRLAFPKNQLNATGREGRAWFMNSDSRFFFSY
jgi:hypothetical protein